MSRVIAIEESAIGLAGAVKTQVLIQAALEQLAKIESLPQVTPPPKILIVAGHSIATIWRPLQTPNPISDPLKYSTSKIEIGESIFTQPNGIGSRLVAAGASSESAALHLLAHELFHVTEATRMSQCGITANECRSGFALGIRRMMESKWREVAALLAREFSSSKRETVTASDSQLSIESLAASDIVSEGCADLLGLEMMQRAHVDWGAFLPALLAVRCHDEQAGRANYQIGSALASLTSPWLITGIVPDEQGIVAATWDLAFEKLKQDPGLQVELLQKIEALPAQLRYSQPRNRLMRIFGKRHG